MRRRTAGSDSSGPDAVARPRKEQPSDAHVRVAGDIRSARQLPICAGDDSVCRSQFVAEYCQAYGVKRLR